MLEGETLDVAPSLENGNMPDPEPSEPTPAPVEAPPPSEPAKPAEPEVALFELPDGRKVTGEELYKEHTEKLLPEFTRRSQELAELKKAPVINNNEPKNPYSDPNYIPQSYEEIIEVAEKRALERIEAREKQQIETKQAVETQVANEIAEIKKVDPNVNVDALFSHAMKYGFSDLPTAYKNMKDMQAVVKATQAETLKNIQKRSDPVATKPGATGTPLNPRSFNSAVDYFRAKQGQ